MSSGFSGRKSCLRKGTPPPKDSQVHAQISASNFTTVTTNDSFLLHDFVDSSSREDLLSLEIYDAEFTNTLSNQ